MRSSRSHTAYLVEVSIGRLITEALQRGRSCYLWTLTFRDEVTDFQEAKQLARPFADMLRRRGGRAVGVWEIQPKRFERTGKAVWHLHVVIDVRLDVLQLRPWLQARGWGNCHVERVHSTRADDCEMIAWQARRIARYVAKYMAKGQGGADWGKAGKMPVAWFVGRSKAGSVTFTWVGGLARLYRLGVSLYLQAESITFWTYRRERLKAAGKRGQLRAFLEMITRMGLEEVWGDPSYAKSAVALGLSPP